MKNKTIISCMLVLAMFLLMPSISAIQTGFAPKLGKKQYFGCKTRTLGAETTKGAKPKKGSVA